MQPFGSDSFNRRYSAEPLHFQEAKSTHFVCQFAQRGDDLIFQYEPTITPIRSDFLPKVQEAYASVLGQSLPKLRVELVEDELLSSGVSVYVEVKDMATNEFAKKMLFSQPFKNLHSALS